MQKDKSILTRFDHQLAEVMWYRLALSAVSQKLGTDLEVGLSEAEAVRRLEAYGSNTLPTRDDEDTALAVILRQLRSPLVYILLFGAFLSLSLRHYSDVAIISLVIAINVVVGFIQERRAAATLRELESAIQPKAKVLRGGQMQEIDAAALVPGDLIAVVAGDRIPADARLTKAVELELGEAALTGEALPARKSTKTIDQPVTIADQDNMVFTGTEVTAGYGQAVVVRTGVATELGRVAQLIIQTRKGPTPLQRSLSDFSRFVTYVTVGLSFFLLILGIIQDRPFLEMLVVAVAIAVAVIPEGLLISLTVILARGMQRILHRRGLVRHLAATETLGAASVICTDKTGTLTLGEMHVVSLVSAGEELHRTRRLGKAEHGHKLVELLKYAALTSSAVIENPHEQIQDWKIIGNLTDRALLTAAAEVGYDKTEMERQYRKLDELPFSEGRKYAVRLLAPQIGKRFVVATGAAEVILKYCRRLAKDDTHIRADSQSLQKLQKRLDELTADGLRVLGVARAFVPAEFSSLPGDGALPEDLVFLGFIGLRDPLRDDVKDSLELARSAGIRLVIVTGDHKRTALAIARQLGWDIGLAQTVEGIELDTMDEATLRRRVSDISLYARVTPEHKLRIIDAWQRRGQVVAMTGDGVNDAPALKKADIGMALGSGTDVARSVADLVLLDNNFQTIVAAIEEGRIIFNNIRRVIVYLLSDNFSQIILIAAALLLGLPLPLLPAQILWHNLVTEGAPNLALTAEPGDRMVMDEPPRRRDEPLVNRQMRFFILVLGIATDLVFLGLYLWLTGQVDLPTARTVVFTALALNSLFYVFSLKSFRQPLWKIKVFDNPLLVVAVGAGIVLQLLAVYWLPLQRLLHTVPLPGVLWGWVLGLSLIKLVALEMAKAYFRRQHLMTAGK